MQTSRAGPAQPKVIVRAVRLALAAGAFWVVGAQGDARADEPPPPDFFAPAGSRLTSPDDGGGRRFGAPRQLVLDGDSNLGVSSSQFSSVDNGSFTLQFNPSIDYFVLRNLSVGLGANLVYSSSQGASGAHKILLTHAATAAGGPRIGFNLPLTRLVSVWPTLALGVESAHRDERLAPGGPATGMKPVASPPTTLVGPTLQLSVPVVLDVTPHLFVGVGPSIFQELGPADGGPGQGGQRTTIAVAMVLGGYLGGEGAAPLGPAVSPSLGPPVTPVATRRFGDAHELALTNDDSLGAHYTSYAGTSASGAGLSFTLGADYFVVKYVSLGAVATGSYVHQVAPDPTRNTTSSWSVAPGGRVGVNIPLGSYLSLYPRVSLSFGPGAGESVTTTRGMTSSNNLDLAVDASLPLLLHVASHFFIGLGPELYRDLWRVVSHGNGPNLVIDQTAVSGELLLGGWL